MMNRKYTSKYRSITSLPSNKPYVKFALQRPTKCGPNRSSTNHTGLNKAFALPLFKLSTKLQSRLQRVRDVYFKINRL